MVGDALKTALFRLFGTTSQTDLLAKVVLLFDTEEYGLNAEARCSRVEQLGFRQLHLHRGCTSQ